MTPEELEQIGEDERASQGLFPHRVNVCVAAGCISCQSLNTKEAIDKEIASRGWEKKCQSKGVGCMGLCAEGPLVSTSAGTLYQHVTPADAGEILDSLEGPASERLLCRTDVPFFQRQKKIVLENSGIVDPERIEEYVGSSGYGALMRVLTEMTPGEVVQEVVRSGLRGRGGAGYPTGLKWSTVAKAAGSQKYVICNADEGDPGAFMDRSVLESDPHRVLEGMADRRLCGRRLEGLSMCAQNIRWPSNVCEQPSSRPSNWVCWAASICGYALQLQRRFAARCRRFCVRRGDRSDRLGRRRARHASSAAAVSGQAGLWGKPTLINNVETFANVAADHSQWRRLVRQHRHGKKQGHQGLCPGRQDLNTGLVEVPMGITLARDRRRHRRRHPGRPAFKAVQTGGPSGGCIPDAVSGHAGRLRIAGRKLGSIMGSGGMIVMDETTSMVDVARFFMEFCMDESCGKCVPCRAGTVQMHDLLTRITNRTAN